MKDNILKESTGGWANGTTPLRIAKRDQFIGNPSGPSNPPMRGRQVARRTSNSFKHVFTNNLVSNSPFKSQIPAPTRRSPRQPLAVASNVSNTAATKTPRKVSGEKRLRPESLVDQADRENALRAKELGFKRRQSKAYLGLVEREVVSKSPFKRDMNGSNIAVDTDYEDEMAQAIPVELPAKRDGQSISPDTTETDSSVNSKESAYASPHVTKEISLNSPRNVKEDARQPPRNTYDVVSTAPYEQEDSFASPRNSREHIYVSPQANKENSFTPLRDDGETLYPFPPPVGLDTPSRALTPPQRPNSQHYSPSPGFERRSPLPSALSGSPARSALSQKGRLHGPRSRSLSAGPSSADTPTRQRRKTVTFDERCDVLEFDRESHEGSVFETDDEAPYAAPGRSSNECNDAMDSSAESSVPSGEYATADYATPTHSPGRIIPDYDAKLLDDSISGLVDSMLKEASNYNTEPSTPSLHSNSLSSLLNDDDLMTGGAENGVPLGRTHHTDRAREYHNSFDSEMSTEPPIPAPFPHQHEDHEPGPDASESEPSFQSTGLSTPPQAYRSPIHADNDVHGNMSLPSLPPDIECDEDGMPLGRSHHAERARAAHAGSHTAEVRPLSGSPSPSKRLAPTFHEEYNEDEDLPKFDLDVGGIRTSSPRLSRNETSPHENQEG